MKTNWEELSKQIGVRREDGTELYQSKNSAEALEIILGDEWIYHAVDTFIDGTPGNELAIKTLRYIVSPKAAAYAYKIFKENKDSDYQKANMAVWALSDIRTQLAMDYIEDIVQYSAYEGQCFAVFRNLVFDHIQWFDEDRLYSFLNKLTKQDIEDVNGLRSFISNEFSSQNPTINALDADFSIEKLTYLEGGITKKENGSYYINIPIQQFEIENKSVQTAIQLDNIILPKPIVEIIGTSLQFPINPIEGYIDGSIYLFERHNPVDVTSIYFKEMIDDLIEVEIQMIFNFEYECTGYKNEILNKQFKLKI